MSTEDTRQAVIRDLVRIARRRYGHVTNWFLDADMIPEEFTLEELQVELRCLESGAPSQVIFDLGKDQQQSSTGR